MPSDDFLANPARACRNKGELFHDRSTDRRAEPADSRVRRERRALILCGVCPVLDACRAYIDDATSDPWPWSVAAAMTPQDRRDRRHGTPRLFADPAPVVVKAARHEHGEIGWSLGCTCFICERWALGATRA